MGCQGGRIERAWAVGVVKAVASVAACMAVGVMGCAGAGGAGGAGSKEPVTWAIAIHGGAGVLSEEEMTPELRAEHARSLGEALSIGREVLASGGTAVDAVERVVRFLEDDPKFNAGRGSVFLADGTHELDAAIMDGRTLKAGAVAGVRTVKNPISLARLVKERTRHVLIAGDGAEAFADAMGVERVPNTYFDTELRRRVLEEVLEERRKEEEAKRDGGAGAMDVGGAADPARAFGTVGAVARDVRGDLAVATSTGGMTAKMKGRIGDSPQIGAGTYANNRTAAISGTGTGEQFIRHTVARDIAALMEYRGMSAREAAEQLVFRTLNPDDGGVIVVSRTGEIAMVFSSIGMYRGAADSAGRFEVGIYKEMEPTAGVRGGAER